MRELKMVGLDADGTYLICEGANPAERFKLPVDERLRAALRGDALPPEQPQLAIDVTNMLSPKEIQARIRAGASVEQVAAASGSDIARIKRFAHPVLLERARAAELATAAHPLLADGPAVLTLLETVTSAFVTRGLRTDGLSWDAWRNEDSRWTVRLAWQAGRSDNVAHFRFTPGSHGGTVTAIDDAASELIDPDFKPPLRPAGAGGAPRLRCRPAPCAPGARRAVRTVGERPTGQARGSGLGGCAARGAHRRTGLGLASRRKSPRKPVFSGAFASARQSYPSTVDASSASQAPATPSPAPSTNQRSTGVRRHPHKVGASPPAATMLRPSANNGCTRISPRLNTTTPTPMTAATNPATAKPVAQGVDWPRSWFIGRA